MKLTGEIVIVLLQENFCINELFRKIHSFSNKLLASPESLLLKVLQPSSRSRMDSDASVALPLSGSSKQTSKSGRT